MSKFPTQMTAEDEAEPEAPTNLATPPAAKDDAAPAVLAGKTKTAEQPPAGDAAAKPTPEPPKVDIAAEVMKRRDAKELASLVRDKRAVESERAKLKEQSAKLEAFREIERMLDEGDDAGAAEALVRMKAGDKANERLATLYNGLTDRLLKDKNGTQQPTQVERGVTHLRSKLETLEQKNAALEARLAERDAAEHEQRIRGAVERVGGYLKDAEHDYPFLMAEADDPGEVVWSILEEAEKHGQELTLEEAAKLANDHFQPTATKKADRYKNLLAPTKANGVPPKPEATRSQVAPPRKSLTNADASQAPTTKTLPPPKNDEERLERAFAALQQGLGKR